MWARRHLGANWSGEVQLKEGHRVVRSGSYAWVRHPIYTGVLAAMVGTALIGGRIQGLLAPPLMLVGFAHKIRLEEDLLLGARGEEYGAYRREVAVLVPFVF